MDENKIVRFRSKFRTGVFWNMDDFPIPFDIDLTDIRSKIEKALEKMGFYGDAEINALGKRLKYDPKELWDVARIDVLPKHTGGNPFMSSATVNKVTTLDMTISMIIVAISMDEPINVVVIAKPEKELLRVMKCFKSRNHNVILVDPTGYNGSIDGLLDTAQLLSGEIPRSKDKDDMMDFSIVLKGHIFLGEDDEYDESVSYIEDFSEPIKRVRGAKTVIFWDAEDCPFPPCSKPDEIYNTIKSDLLGRRSSNKISIWAYLDEDKKDSSCWRNEFLCDKKTWDSRIYFIPAGDKPSRRIRMLNDMFLYVLDCPDDDCISEANFMLVADQFKGDTYYMRMLENLFYRANHLFLVTPFEDTIDPERPKWPEYLFDEGWYTVPDEETNQSEEEVEPCPKRLKANAVAEETP